MKYLSNKLFTLGLVIWACAACIGCGGSEDACLSNRDFFEQRLWVPLMSKNCSNCHAPGGAAASVNAKFLLLPTSYPQFLDADLDNASNVARIQYNGTSELLLKPLGQMDHGGGKVLDASDPAYADLKTFVSRVNNPPSCASASPTAAVAAAQQLDAEATLRRVTIQLTGALPDATTTAALHNLTSSTQAAEARLVTEVQNLTETQAFLQRLQTIFNDTLLTEQYDQGGSAIGLLNSSDYPAITTWYNDSNTLAADKQAANHAVAIEPLALLSYIVQNNHPLTELLSADYTVVNPWSARIYGVTPTFQNAADPNTFVPAQLSITRNGQQLALPHAGVLTMPTFLNRFPTTVTNRNRHRARWVLDMFLATDILSFGTRPIDATAGSNYANPTRDNPQCNVCHKVLDPIAGDFQKWDDNNQDYWDPNRIWHTDMAPPGFGTDIMDTANYTHAEQWLAQKMIADARFGTAMLNILYQGLLGQAPLTYPTDPTSTTFASDQAAWHLQDALFKQYNQDFVASNYNLKTLVVDLLTGPLYRTVNISGFKDPSNESALDPREIQAVLHMGTYALLEPELLNNKITALTGVTWGGANNPLLLNDYRILYGGIDSDAVTVRLAAPNGLMANLALGMATQVSCQAVPQDFALAVSARRFFPDVELDYTPQTSDGADIPSHIALIKENIAYLHQYLLGETDDTEVAATYDLFEATWREGIDAVTAGTTSANLPYNCQVNQDANGTNLPQASRIDSDNTYVIRAWMAVMTYLLTDYRFLYD